MSPEPPPGRPDAREREEWRAVVAADTLGLLPEEALIATCKHLAGRCLELAALLDAYHGLPAARP